MPSYHEVRGNSIKEFVDNMISAIMRYEKESDIDYDTQRYQRIGKFEVIVLFANKVTQNT